MPERIAEHLTMLLYAIAAISGGLGGCAAAGYQTLKGSRPRASFFLAYVSLGVLFGALTFAYGATFGIGINSLDTLIGPSMLAGFGGSLSLASSNISARWLLHRLGVEVEVTVKRKDKRRTKVIPDEHADL